jgi:hypothetical protein
MKVVCKGLVQILEMIKWGSNFVRTLTRRWAVDYSFESTFSWADRCKISLRYCWKKSWLKKLLLKAVG